MADELVNMCPTVPPHYSTQSHDTTPGGGGGSGKRKNLRGLKISLLHKSSGFGSISTTGNAANFFPKIYLLSTINEHNCTLRESSIGCGHSPRQEVEVQFEENVVN